MGSTNNAGSQEELPRPGGQRGGKNLPGDTASRRPGHGTRCWCHQEQCNAGGFPGLVGRCLWLRTPQQQAQSEGTRHKASARPTGRGNALTQTPKLKENPKPNQNQTKTILREKVRKERRCCWWGTKATHVFYPRGDKKRCGHQYSAAGQCCCSLNPGGWVNRVPRVRCDPPGTQQQPPQFVFVFLVLWFFPIKVLHEGPAAGPLPQLTLSPRSTTGPISVGSS